MMMSLDGRIDCSMTEKIGTDDYYEALDSLECDSTLEGRTTVKMHYALPDDFTQNDFFVGKECFHKAAPGGYQIFVDTKGTLTYPANSSENRLCLLSEQASSAYLKYLESIGYSYIVCGKERIDLAQAVEILAEKFNVKRLAVVGGGRINGAFLSANLIDEISAMIAPGIDGRTGEPNLFDGLSESTSPIQLELASCRQMKQGTIWAKYKPKRNEAR